MISNLVLVSYFLQKEYRWHPQEERAIRAVFETKGSCILKSAMNKIRNGQDKGKWLSCLSTYTWALKREYQGHLLC